jgi:rsbT co-antagonist protein RsbR
MALELSGPGAEQKFSTQDIEQRKRYVGLDADDLQRIAGIRHLVDQHAESFTATFFEFLRPLPEAALLFRQPALLTEARRLKHLHLVAMVAGDYGPAYASERARLALLYSRAAIDVRVFLGAFHHLMRGVGAEIMKHRAGQDPQAAFLDFMALKKIAFFDLGIMVDVLIEAREHTITLQQKAIRELSTPVLQVRDRLLVLPIIGVVDSQRAKQLTDSLLQAIRTNRARVVVMDVTGVAAVDSKVANHLIQTMAAARLMGARAIITGISVEVAQALVALGGEAILINAVGDLQGGIEEAERLLGLQVVALPTSGQA